VADAVASFMKLWSGGQSDQTGRRKGFIVFGYCVPALARPLVSVIVAPREGVPAATATGLSKDSRLKGLRPTSGCSQSRTECH
jgi:hypothetical protein